MLLQVGEPAQTRPDLQKAEDRIFKNLLVNLYVGCQHLHCFLVWFEQLAGELAEDSQVGEVRWCRCFWGLTKLLEHILYAVPAHINT